LSYLNALLLSFDIFGKKHHFSVKKEQSTKTWSGCVVSIIAVLLIVAFYVIEGFSTYKLKEPRSSVGISTLKETTKVNIYDSDIFEVYMVIDIGPGWELRNTDIDHIGEYFTIKSYLETGKTDFETGEFEIFSRQEIQPRACTDMNDERYISMYKYFDERHSDYQRAFLCIHYEKDKHFEVEGSNNGRLYKKVVVNIFPCSLEDQSRCKSRDTINSISVMMGHKARGIDLSLPIDEVFFGSPVYIDFRINSDCMNHMIKYYTEGHLLDDDSSFRSPEQVASFYNLEDNIVYGTGYRDGTTFCSLHSIEDGSCIPYYQTEIRAGRKVVYYLRQFPKWMETLGMLGGLRDVILFLATFIVWILNFDYMQKLSINGVFKWDEIELASKIFDSTSKELQTLFEHDSTSVVHATRISELMSEILLTREQRLLTSIIFVLQEGNLDGVALQKKRVQTIYNIRKTIRRMQDLAWSQEIIMEELFGERINDMIDSQSARIESFSSEPKEDPNDKIKDVFDETAQCKKDNTIIRQNRVRKRELGNNRRFKKMKIVKPLQIPLNSKKSTPIEHERGSIKFNKIEVADPLDEFEFIESN